ncbi:hypothetical protein ACFL4T_07645, partial [candidate division KSB1 bacterium]
MENNISTFPVHPEADKFCAITWNEIISRSPEIHTFERDLLVIAGVKLIDLIDFFILPDKNNTASELESYGYKKEEIEIENTYRVFNHPLSILPRFLLKSVEKSGNDFPLGAGFKVENLNRFLEVNQIAAEIEGANHSPFRKAKIWSGKKIEIFAVERNGYRGFNTSENNRDFELTYKNIYDKWDSRQRVFNNSVEGMIETLKLSGSLASDADKHLAANIIFKVERKFWQSKNKAGQMQYDLQDKYGIGWINHDHHTFRSSRITFHMLIQILESLGFVPREKFYAGAEAGWGAQVMEQPECGLLVFADVDLSPEELEGDFA